MTMPCFVLAIFNGTTIPVAGNDRVYLKPAVDNFKKSTRSRLQQKINEKNKL